MRVFCLAWVFCLLACISLPIHAYGVSVVLEQKRFADFSYVSYGYSSLFRQGRDGFHWFDLNFANYDYFTAQEAGKGAAIGSAYRYTHRLRWARHFKPIVIAEAGITQLRRNQRQRIDAANQYAGRLVDRQDIEYTLGVGTGYLWEIRGFLLMSGLKFAYSNTYAQSHLAPFFIFSFNF